MTETFEVCNETNKTILVSGCRSKLSGRLYVHVGKAHGNETVVKAHESEIIVVKEVEG
jgi:hypothetical protein